jgi:flagellar biosynthesis protein FlhA
MPHVVFLAWAAFGYGAWLAQASKSRTGRRRPEAGRRAATQQDGEATWDDLQPVDLLGLELGYRLIALVDKNRQGDLLTRIKGVRRKFAQEVGFLPPAVHVRDNLELKPSAYRITLRGVMVGEGEAFPGMFLAINPGGITTPLIGTATTDPAFGLPAHWIDERQKEAAQMAGFTVVDSETVMATHLSHLMQVHAAKLLAAPRRSSWSTMWPSWPPS